MAEIGSLLNAHGRAWTRHLRGLLGIPLLAVCALLGGVTSFVLASGSAAAATSVTVHIGDAGIDPTTATVEPGGTVVWVNDATSVHTVVATDASFDSGPLEPGEQFQFAFTEARTVSYEIPEIAGASGTVVVEAAATTAVPGESPFVTQPTSPTAPTGFAYTGSSTAFNALIGGTILAIGASLLVSARRFGLAGALTGLPFAFVPDDLLPTRRHRRLLRVHARRSLRR